MWNDFVVISTDSHHALLQSGVMNTVWQESFEKRMFGKFSLFKQLTEKIWQMNRSPKGLYY